ncbi:hypothetical protein [Bradyrhizobium sp. 141]|uniref:hypothetical protein n=1 Tax=Bradyrhizobium sp. 141 TaxID=2782617 RepID=UPI001FF7CEA6|nr:hypothetical protein [Bradyrhizobium sp. 141]
MGASDVAIGKAKFLRNYSKDVTLLWQNGSGPDDRKDIDEAGVVVATGIGELKMSDQNIRVTTNEGEKSFDVLYPALGCEVRSDLAVKLGAATGETDCLKVDEHQCTTVAGRRFRGRRRGLGPSPDRGRHRPCRDRCHTHSQDLACASPLGCSMCGPRSRRTSNEWVRVSAPRELTFVNEQGFGSL